MQIQMTGHNVEVTPALREFTENKFQKLTTHSEKITSIHVTFTIDHLDQIAEAQINVPGSSIHAKASAEKMYTAIDALLDKCVRQLDKYREKHNEHRE